ncbi:MAG: hypothetical protein NC548_45410 [Lachnospiraceae bacterium]|nr:hypothetical protein [Lachnospiraceae bacterium]
MNTIMLELQVSRLYRLRLESKFTIIAGESGSKKTALFTEIIGDDDRDLHFPNVKIIPFGSEAEAVDAVLNGVNPDIVLMLDEMSISMLRKMHKAVRLNSLNCHVVIVSHEPLKDLLYSYNDVYQLHGDDILELYPVYNRRDTIPDADVYFTEDTNSGYQYFKRWL